jgi:hypothetical protein
VTWHASLDNKLLLLISSRFSFLFRSHIFEPVIVVRLYVRF